MGRSGDQADVGRWAVAGAGGAGGGDRGKGGECGWRAVYVRMVIPDEGFEVRDETLSMGVPARGKPVIKGFLLVGRPLCCVAAGLGARFRALSTNMVRPAWCASDGGGSGARSRLALLLENLRPSPRCKGDCRSDASRDRGAALPAAPARGADAGARASGVPDGAC